MSINCGNVTRFVQFVNKEIRANLSHRKYDTVVLPREIERWELSNGALPVRFKASCREKTLGNRVVYSWNRMLDYYFHVGR